MSAYFEEISVAAHLLETQHLRPRCCQMPLIFAAIVECGTDTADKGGPRSSHFFDDSRRAAQPDCNSVIVAETGGSSCNSFFRRLLHDRDRVRRTVGNFGGIRSR